MFCRFVNVSVIINMFCYLYSMEFVSILYPNVQIFVVSKVWFYYDYYQPQKLIFSNYSCYSFLHISCSLQGNCFEKRNRWIFFLMEWMMRHLNAPLVRRRFKNVHFWGISTNPLAFPSLQWISLLLWVWSLFLLCHFAIFIKFLINLDY